MFVVFISRIYHSKYHLMKRRVDVRNSIVLLTGLFCFGCSASKNASNQPIQTVDETNSKFIDVNNLKAGIVAYRASNFDYKRDGQTVLKVELKEPVVVAIASQPEKWGYFQFPDIMHKRDNSLLVTWHLNPDAMEAYGNHKFGSAISKDGGATWQLAEYNGDEGGFELPNGDRIKVHTPKPIKATELNLPKPVDKIMGDTYSKSAYEFYKLHDLPEQVNGVYIDRLPKGSNEWKTERASLYDPQAVRYTLRGMFPIVWWGDMHIAKDKSLIAGIYPGFEINSSGSVNPYHEIFFYRSVDNGHSWKIQGRIQYVADTVNDPIGPKRMGLMEPAYEILPDGSFVCVMRTTDGIGNGPMYISHSNDLGVTWTKPEIITPSGVLPHLLQLKNGVLVMSSGRPGVQLRFSADGEGKMWTDAFEMMPYKDYNDQVSCGYTGILPTGPDRFLLVYSDFRYPNKEGEPRKAIKVREVIVHPHK